MNSLDSLKINGRQRLPASEFKSSDLLYRGFSRADLDEQNHIAPSSIKFPDFSCNWSRFSMPEHIRNRSPKADSEGVYEFSVEVSKYKNIAMPCHDPIEQSSETANENYAHTEVRVLKEGSITIDNDPPKGRKLNSNAKKLEYRTNLSNHLKILLEPL